MTVHQKGPLLWPPGGAFALLGAPRGRGASALASTCSTAAPSAAGGVVAARGARGLVLKSLALAAEAEFLGWRGAAVPSPPNPMEVLPPGGATTCRVREAQGWSHLAAVPLSDAREEFGGGRHVGGGGLGEGREGGVSPQMEKGAATA